MKKSNMKKIDIGRLEDLAITLGEQIADYISTIESFGPSGSNEAIQHFVRQLDCMLGNLRQCCSDILFVFDRAEMLRESIEEFMKTDYVGE
jgi:hypothetical protein